MNGESDEQVNFGDLISGFSFDSERIRKRGIRRNEGRAADRQRQQIPEHRIVSDAGHQTDPVRVGKCVEFEEPPELCAESRIGHVHRGGFATGPRRAQDVTPTGGRSSAAHRGTSWLVCISGG